MAKKKSLKPAKRKSAAKPREVAAAPVATRKAPEPVVKPIPVKEKPLERDLTDTMKVLEDAKQSLKKSGAMLRKRFAK